MGVSSQHDLTRTAVSSLLYQRFASLALEQAGVASADSWADEPLAPLIETILGDGDWTVARARDNGFQAWLATADNLVLYCSANPYGGWSAAVAASSQEAASQRLAEFVDQLPAAPEQTADGGVLVRFWTLGPLGPVSYHRRVDAAPWADVQDNYPADVRAGLDRLMTMSAPSAGGRLVLLHGPPGTGKTHAIRALAQDLASWCDVDYVIDVDAFFETASYMVQTMVMDETYVPIAEDGSAPEERWRIVVLEDSGEYLRNDATDKVGLGLGRLLNLADGLVGQGLRIILLMTTNEPVDELHPAVTRPGRCMENLQLGSFPPDEAAAWLATRGLDREVAESATLAELYAMLGDAARETRLESLTAAVARGTPVDGHLHLVRWSA